MMADYLKVAVNRNVVYTCSLEIERPAEDGAGKVWERMPVIARSLEPGETRDRRARGWVCSEKDCVSIQPKSVGCR